MATIQEVILPGRTVNGWLHDIGRMIGYDLRLKILIKEQVLSDSLSLAEFVVKPGEFKKVPFVEPKVNYMLKITSGSEIYVLHGNRARRWVSLTFTPVVMFELYEDKTRKLIDWN